MKRTGVAVALAVVSTAAVAIAVLGSAQSTTDTEKPSRAAGGLPPDDRDALATVFDPVLRSVGLRVARAGLQNGPGAQYDEALVGRHLALYVEPLDGAHTPDDYLDTLVASAKVFLPRVFERWPDLVSMDVCQEPPPGVDDRPQPPPVTVLELTREEAETLVWETLDLPALVAAADEGLVKLFVAPDVEADPRWRAAEAEADRRSPPIGAR